MGNESEFFIHGRPRSNSTGITSVPPVATVFAGLSRHEWSEFRRQSAFMVSSVDYSEWRKKEAQARSKCKLKPFIAMPVTHAGWCDWSRQQPDEADLSIHHYATDLFQKKIQMIIREARERTPESVLPRRYMLVNTEQIGQDLAFDLSHLAEINTLSDGTDRIDVVWVDKTIFFEYAIAVACAEAISRGVDCVFWEKDNKYAWI